GTIDNLPAGEATSFEYDANGATWHFRVDQAEGHPGELAPIAFVEGCGGLTPDIVNQFSFNDADPFVAIDCQPAIGAFDPNDKLAYPKGYGDQNYIEANELIEYKIRFQNTGTDTAFNVVLEDQLSEWLDPSTIKLGASSHPYRMEIDENATMRFYFDNILLPDSTTNEPASHGFVQFQIEQQLDNPLGTVIENFADIFFDFNEPIRTNTVFHTIGEAFVLVNTIEGPAVETLSLKWLPNPAREEVRFEFEDYEVKDGHLELLDQQGRRLHVQVFSGKQTRLIRQLEWPNGLYFFRLTDSKGLHVAGKLQLN
ncbi:MAG: T9SS type A sorting domain-containing protein, partial [Bacteroidota bacterium]